MPAAERAQIFGEAAERKDLADAIVEKNFWVCWVLIQLFAIEELSGRLLFKGGGTSLSRFSTQINRFSEDIDLAVELLSVRQPRSLISRAS